MTVDVARAPAARKIRWSEVDENDGGDLSYLLPPRVVDGPDENGMKTTTEYKFNDNGEIVKIITVSRVRKIAHARLSKRALERRSWAKFGGAADNAAESRLTMVSMEEIVLERPRTTGSKAEEPKTEPKTAGDLKHCRTCGKKGDHWTARCPYKDLASQVDGFIDMPSTSDTATSSGTGKNTYVPPRMRDGEQRPGPEMRRRNDENSVRVTNLSEDTREPDLLELFRSFGPVTRVYVAIDQRTGVSRGFGFVNFVSKEDAERAINKLNGYGYDNLILRVEWATPRPN